MADAFDEQPAEHSTIEERSDTIYRVLRELAGGPDHCVFQRRATLALAAVSRQGDHDVRSTGCRWRARFADEGLSALYDGHGEREESSIVAEDRIDVTLRAALVQPAPQGKWTARALADATGIPKSTVARRMARIEATRRTEAAQSNGVCGFLIDPPVLLIVLGRPPLRQMPTDSPWPKARSSARLLAALDVALVSEALDVRPFRSHQNLLNIADLFVGDVRLGAQFSAILTGYRASRDLLVRQRVESAVSAVALRELRSDIEWSREVRTIAARIAHTEAGWWIERYAGEVGKRLDALRRECIERRRAIAWTAKSTVC